jgi:cytochrome c biogenesis protein CcdA
VSSLRRNGEALEDLHNAGKDVRRIGSFYILGVWLAYLLIGLSLFQGLRLAPFPNLIGLISSLIVILFGILNVANFFWPGKFSLRMSSSQWGTVRRWMRKFTVPTAFVAGLLVSIFEFPCTGGIYISILGLLAQNTSFLEGFSYLLIYNVAFVIPLVSIVVFMSIKDVSTFSLENWEQKYGKQMRLILGLIMITIGLFLVFWEYT